MVTQVRPRHYRGQHRRPAVLARLVCAVVGHRRVRVITGIDVVAVSPAGDVGGRITGSRTDCARCGRTVAGGQSNG